MYLNTNTYGGNEHHFQGGRGTARREAMTEQPVTSAGCKALACLSQTPCGPQPSPHPLARPEAPFPRVPRALSLSPRRPLRALLVLRPPPGLTDPRQMGRSLAHTEPAPLGE